MANKNLGSKLPRKSVEKSVIKAATKNVAKKAAEIRNKVKAKQQGGKNTLSSNRLKLLVTIVGRRKAEYYIDFIQSFDVNMQCVVMARGTANESTLELLGLSDSEKVVILSVVQENRIPDLLSALGDKFNSIKDGKGVAWANSLFEDNAEHGLGIHLGQKALRNALIEKIEAMAKNCAEQGQPNAVLQAYLDTKDDGAANADAHAKTHAGTHKRCRSSFVCGGRLHDLKRLFLLIGIAFPLPHTRSCGRFNVHFCSGPFCLESVALLLNFHFINCGKVFIRRINI